MSAFFAFLHHIAAFTLVAALAVEFVLIKGDLTLANARRLSFADLVFGVSAGTVLVVGVLRVLYFEKGADYYLHNAAFIAKLSLFAIIAVMSIYPTMEFLAWRKSLQQGRLPVVAESKLRAVRAVIHWELVAIVLVILCAALMARGVGYFG